MEMQRQASARGGTADFLTATTGSGIQSQLVEVAKQRTVVDSEEQLHRLRKICATLPETSERLSHGAPTFFARKRVYAMFANNHHNDGHVAVWIPTPPGFQAMLIQTWPRTFFKPPYVGVKGWVGIELDMIGDEELVSHLSQAWRLVAPKKPRAPG